MNRFRHIRNSLLRIKCAVGKYHSYLEKSGAADGATLPVSEGGPVPSESLRIITRGRAVTGLAGPFAAVIPSILYF
jgi:hypothetical protein